MQHGYTKQRTDSCPRQDGAGQHKFDHATHKGAQFKAYSLFISGIFHSVFSDHG